MPKRRPLLPVLAVPALMSLSLSQSAPKDPCANAQTTAEITACTATAYKNADAQLNRAYTALLAKMRTKALPKPAQGLVEAQRAWIAYRDRTCAVSASLYAGGTLESSVRAQCLTDETRSRIASLGRLDKSLPQ